MEVRQACEKDFEQFPHIFNQVYREYSLYTVRTPQQYKQVVEKLHAKEYTFVVEDTTMKGYVIAGVKCIGDIPTVSVYEVVALNKQGYDLLINHVEAIGVQVGAAFIDAVAVPKTETATHLVEAHFLESRPLAAMVFTPAVNPLLEQCTKAVPGRTVLFCVGCEKIQVQCGDSGDGPDITVVISSKDFISLLLGRTSVFSLVIKGKMQITPWYKVLAVRSVVNYVAKDIKMITPYTEMV
jgi:hypothetical protein